MFVTVIFRTLARRSVEEEDVHLFGMGGGAVAADWVSGGSGDTF